MIWKTSRRELDADRTLVMAILNVTPDSFSDGGRFASADAALARVEEMMTEGADIIDIGGESTRPNSARVDAATEIGRVVPVIAEIAKRFDVPISIDTSKDEVARAAIDAGAEIVNDVSGLRFDPAIARTVAAARAGLVVMHLRGSFETMHLQTPADDVFGDVEAGWNESLRIADEAGVARGSVALDIGLGFSKSFDQNLELVANLDRLVRTFDEFPILVGASRKSFIGKLLGGAPPEKRLGGSLAMAAVAVDRGARIVRVHDVAETVRAVRVAEALRREL